MRRAIDETHDPALRSWVELANAPGCDFPIQNLPFGVFVPRGEEAEPRIGTAIGDRVLDLARTVDEGLLASLGDEVEAACVAPRLDALLELGADAWSALRRVLSRILRADAPERQPAADLLVPLDGIELVLPATIGDYTDFYASIHHATNVGRLFRPENPLLPNYKYVPIAYHGRSSSIVPSGSEVRRPSGQRTAPGVELPEFGPSRSLDYEVELGVIVGPGNKRGTPVAAGDAEAHLFGVLLVNDWSARDIQAWEYQPLGPFLSKSFATSVSPWVVTFEALAPFRCPAFARPESDPAPLPYLDSSEDRSGGGIDLTLEAWLRTDAMRQGGDAPVRLSRASFRDMYWTVSQMLAHHTSNGCNLRPGDLLASGTVSGPGDDSRGSLLEITERATRPLVLPNGEERRFLEDGDEVILRGYAQGEGKVRIGLGECRGVVVPG